ncbi:MAG: carboxylate/amino acid/amine transporter [Candidatus Accumulibacter appositus]|uniref:Carboxylate/amino acid/amine transporter n=1 Tax=Candidatus Accumulibacter appositus TaxID=1454003 RepID=A0A011PN32_9PROT|nr:DMT family transporter [Accumulibacter sp.]EXI78275.1 MAG: carboxylate/amino acid/amine transporter [Candidatus Accumulibacter appositus]HRF06632.1 DMT family transporter [Accumulibacter sp.]
MKGKARQIAGPGGARQQRLAIGALLGGALIWGVIWYPYRLLRDAGVDGIASSTITYAIAFALGLLIFRRSPLDWAPSWTLFWLALAAAACNLGYVLATLNGEVVRVLLLFYLAPLWTVLLSRLLLDERLSRAGAGVIALSLLGAATMLWQPQVGLPAPQDLADWLGLVAGFAFALFNVLSRRAGHLRIESKVMAAFAGVVITGALLLLAGLGRLHLPTAPSLWLLLALLGCVLVVANLVVQFGLARVAANRAVVIMLTEIGFAALAAWLLADEALAARDWLGGALIVAASLFSARMEERRTAV